MTYTTAILTREQEINSALAAVRRIQDIYERPRAEGPWITIATPELDDICRVQRFEDRIVASYAGTRTKKQWMSNFAKLARMKRNADGTRTHAGATEAFHRFQNELIAALLSMGAGKYEPGALPVDGEGHSRGGFHTLEFGRLFADRVNIRDVLTFGSPRVGDFYHAEIVKSYAQGRIIRWTHNNDFVVCLPGSWRGYRHVGELRHIDSAWRVRNSALGVLSGFADGVVGRVKAGMKGRVLDGTDDHRLPTGYIPALEWIAGQRDGDTEGGA